MKKIRIIKPVVLCAAAFIGSLCLLHAMVVTKPDSVAIEPPTVQIKPEPFRKPPSGLVALWSGEDSGRDSVGGNNATPVGKVAYAKGQVRRAFSLNGQSSYLKVPASRSLDVGAGDGLTITAWIKPSAANAVDGKGGPIIEWDSSSSDGVSIWAQGCNNLIANLKGTPDDRSTLLQTPNWTLNTNSFQFVAVTYDRGSGAAVLYINGVVVAARNLGSYTPQTSYPVNIGRRTGQPLGDGDNYGGLIDELAVYNRALSASEIRAICAEQNHGELPPAPPSASTQDF